MIVTIQDWDGVWLCLKRKSILLGASVQPSHVTYSASSSVYASAAVGHPQCGDGDWGRPWFFSMTGLLDVDSGRGRFILLLGRAESTRSHTLISQGLDSIHEPFGASELSGKVSRKMPQRKLGWKIGSWQTWFFLFVLGPGCRKFRNCFTSFDHWLIHLCNHSHQCTHTQACPCAHALANTKLSRREIWWDALQDACWLCRYRCRLVWLQQWPASWSKALKFHILWLVNQCQSINIHRCQIRFCQIGHCSQAGLCERTTQVWNCATELLPCNKLPVLILFDRHSRRIDSRTVNPWAPTVNQAVVSCAQARDSC